MHQFNALNQTGTYWYHSHLSAQYCDGLRGPLVIYDPDDPYKDWYDVDDGACVSLTFGQYVHKPISEYRDHPYRLASDTMFSRDRCSIVFMQVP